MRGPRTCGGHNGRASRGTWPSPRSQRRPSRPWRGSPGAPPRPPGRGESPVGSAPMGRVTRAWALLVGLLAACAGTGPRMGETPEPAGEVTSWEEGCEDARNLVLVCQEDGAECGLFPCREGFAPGAMVAYRGGA